ncbi:S8 family serine peptidase [Falsiroseomonas sp.]|uniref:S8 family serine peptidase n=1 Tax=Falsiroseomonas sp. TaxID=2870721 RepID=UPI00356975A6
MTRPQGRMRRLLRHALPAMCAGLLLAAVPAMADDDDDGPGGSAAGGEGSDLRGQLPAGAPSTGSFIGDLRGLLGSIAPGIAVPAPAPAEAPASRPAAPAPRPPQRAATVPNEITAIGLDQLPRSRLLAAGFTIIEEVPAEIVPGSIARLGLPRGLTAAAARDLARSLAPAARFDLTHLYRPGGDAAVQPVVALGNAACAARPVGVVDTGVDPAHPALAGRQVEQVTRRSAGRAAAGTAHGTAVAALLASAIGAAPILVVDAFHRRPDGDAADAFDIAAALALLATRGIKVVNLSFAGPANEVLALATERAAAHGMLLAAAAGNDGPRSPPRYPAAYPWVVAVTAVDAQARPFIRAVRGSHLAFAARGVGLEAPGRGGASLSGTSYAVPFVTAAFARAMTTEDREAALLRLAGSAQDLGPPGRDAVFGWGLIRPESGCAGGA